MNIHFINQINYPDLPYHTGIESGGLPGHENTFAYGGCGVCCLIMSVEACKGIRIPLDEGIKYAMDSGSTRHYGTDLDVLLEYALPRYGMSFEMTDDINRLRVCILDGGVAVANTGGDRDGYSCPFSPRGHYVFVHEINGDECLIFDTSFRPEKYTRAAKAGEVTVRDDDMVVTTLAYLDRACNNKRPRYILIK